MISSTLRTLVAVCSLWFSTSALALQDVLELPAMPSALSAESLLIDVAEADNRLVAVGERGHIVYSDDKGQSWTQADVPVSVLLTGVYFVDAKHGWAVGHGGVILGSTDGGKSWVKQFDGIAANTMLIQQAEEFEQDLASQVAALQSELDSAEDEDLAADLEYELDDLLFALEDAQFALEDAQADAEVGASKPFLDVWFKDAKEGFAVGAYGLLFKTIDGGRTWSNYGGNMDNIDRFHLNAITRLDSGELMVVGEAGTMFRSTDLGETWETLASPYGGSFFGVVAVPGKSSAFAFGLRGNLFLTQDAGLSWEAVATDTESSLMSATFFDDSRLAIVGNSGVILFSSDQGQTYTQITRADRLGIAGSVFVDTDAIVLVGEAGAKLADSSGADL